MKKIVSMFLILAMLMTMITVSAAEGEKPFAGQTLTVAVEDGGPYAIWYESIKNRFEEMTGATVNLVGSTSESEAAELLSKSGFFDVFTMDGPAIPQYATMGYLLPLDDMVDKDELADFYDAAIESCSWDGHLYSLPYLVHGPVMYYRKSLLEKAGFDHAPTTNEEYLSMAQALNDPDNGVYGTLIEGKQSSEAVSHLIDKIYQFGGMVIDDNDPTKIAFNCQGTVDAFEWMMKFFDTKCIPAECASYNNGDAQNMFLEGSLALCCNWPYMWEMCNDPEYSKVIGDVGVVAQPLTNAVWSWSFGICAHSKNVELAYEWLKWSTSSEILTEFGQYFINPVTRASSAEAAVAAITDPDDAAVLAAMNQSLAQGVAPQLSTNYDEIRPRIALTLNRICNGTATDIAAEVAECAEELQTILDEAY